MVRGTEGADCANAAAASLSYRIESRQHRTYCIQIFYRVARKGGAEGVIRHDAKLLPWLWVEEMLLIPFGAGGRLLYVEPKIGSRILRARQPDRY